MKKDGTYWIWGNDYQSVPTQLQGLDDVKVSFDDQLIMKDDGSVWHWTRDSLRSVKVDMKPVEGLNDLIDYLPGSYNDISVALDADGGVFRVPKVESQPDFSRLTAISGLSDVIKISRWDNNYLYLKHDGTV